MTITTVYIVTQFLSMHLFSFFLPSIAIGIAASIGLWSAFGISSLRLRTLGLVVGIFLLALTGATLAERSLGTIGVGLGLLVVGLAFWLGNESNFIWLGMLIGLWGYFIYLVADDRVLSSVWAIRIALFSYLLCVPFAMLRLFGFHFLNITGGLSENQIDLRSGQSLEKWFTTLDRADAYKENHAEIMTLLRGYGLEYSLQRVITIAYLQSRKRSSLRLSLAGRLIGSEKDPTFSDTLLGSRLQQFTIGHLVFTTFAVACTVRLGTYLKWPVPARDELVRGGIFAIGISIVLTVIALEMLAINKTQLRSRVRTILAIVIVLVLPISFGGNAADNILTKPGQVYYGGILFVLYSTGMFYIALALIRLRGYRLVRSTVSENRGGSVI